MYIGELARLAGVHVQTIRYYEREGLLAAPQRTASGYRRYERADLERFRFIRRSQELGFTLAEIRELGELHRTMASPGGRHMRRPNGLRGVARIARERLETIEGKLRDLRAMRRQMAAFLARLGAAGAGECPAGPRRRAIGR